MCKATYPNIASSSKICEFQQTANMPISLLFSSFALELCIDTEETASNRSFLIKFKAFLR
jgi:hypothetical protein